MSVPIFQNHAKQNNFQVRIVIVTGGTVGQAEWLIEGTHIFVLLILEMMLMLFTNRLKNGRTLAVWMLCNSSCKSQNDGQDSFKVMPA